MSKIPCKIRLVVKFTKFQSASALISTVVFATAALVCILSDATSAQILYYGGPDFLKILRIENTELRGWSPPENLKRSFPYYFAGYDLKDRPVWLIEYGKWDMEKVLENTGMDSNRLYEKYTDQLAYICHNSPKLFPRNQSHPTTDEWVLIVDLEGFDHKQLSSREVIRQTLKLTRKFGKAATNIGYVFVVNANKFGQVLVNVVRPVLGSLFDRFQVYGTYKDTWMPEILKKISQENLPEWYGGLPNYSPIAVYG